MRGVVLIVVSALALLQAVPAIGAPGLLVGFADDVVKWQPTAARQGQQLGARIYRVTLGWQPGAMSISPSEIATFSRLPTATARFVVSVYGTPDPPPPPPPPPT